MTNNRIGHLPDSGILPLLMSDEIPSRKKLAKGRRVFRPQDIADKIYFIQSGRVKLVTFSKGGREVTKAIYGEGDFFGELCLVGEETRRNYAIAMEETSLLVLTHDEIEQRMRQNTGLRMLIMEEMGARLVEMERRLESLVFKKSRTRVIEYLLYLIRKKGQRVGYEMLVRRFLTHQEIANVTATSRQTVTTVLNDLRNRKVLTFNRRRLLVRDMERLQAEALVV